MKLVLFSVSDSLKEKVGHFILLFAQVEWFIGNVIFYAQMSPEDYQKLGENHPVGVKYLHTIFQLDFYKKLDSLQKEGFDVIALKRIQKYRAVLAHGLMFDKDGIINISKPHKEGEEIILNEEELDQNISTLEEEGGKLRQFLETKGFRLREPKLAEEEQ
jgi:hypothetical protein